ncbi:uncharacterized protein TNCV_854411 [Trichonephila clavipes]|nr:uncharacterized protein TNCV_854411 [Trichonephila clavipes]
MWIVIFIIVGAASVKGEEVAVEAACDDARMITCSSFYPDEDIEKAGMTPSEDDLDKFCPDLLKMTNCIDNFEEDCGQPKEDVFPYFVYEKAVYKEMCIKDSKLRSLFLQTLDCFKKVGHLMKPCHNKATDAYKIYNESINHNEVEIEENYELCLEMSYTLGCLGVEIRTTCDEEAYRRFLEIEKVKESYWFKTYCMEVDYEKEIQTGFLSSTNVEEDQKRIYNEVFDLLRKKVERL